MNMIAEPDRLCPDVEALIDDYNNVLCISAETLREMIVAFNNKGLASKCWHTANDMIHSLVEEYNLVVLPLKTERLPLISSDTRFPFYKDQGLDLIENR